MGIVTLGVSATGRHVAAIGADNVLRVWSSSGGRVLREPDALGALQRPETTGTPSYGYTLRPVQVFVSDQQAIGLTADGRLGTWPFDGQSSAVDFERPVTAFSAVGGTIAFAIDGAAAVAQDGAVLRNIPQACPDAAPVTSLLLAPDRRRLAVMCPWATTLLYDLESGESFRTDHHERGGGTAFAFSPDGRTYAHGNNGAGSLNIHGEVEITDAATGEAVQTFGSRLIRTADLAFNPARPELALYWDGGAHVWDLEEGRVVARSFGRSRDLAYAADGESIWLLDSGRDTASQTYRWEPRAVPDLDRDTDAKEIIPSDCHIPTRGMWASATLTADGTVYCHADGFKRFDRAGARPAGARPRPGRFRTCRRWCGSHAPRAGRAVGRLRVLVGARTRTRHPLEHLLQTATGPGEKRVVHPQRRPYSLSVSNMVAVT